MSASLPFTCPPCIDCCHQYDVWRGKEPKSMMEMVKTKEGNEENLPQKAENEHEIGKSEVDESGEGSGLKTVAVVA
ncbi:hypothetical protein JYU34_019577 [Plutella xylostella]|uniref:Uncharacterized protein n=1 Tax=Plutella xylostella TaxID=51655 RepID=A0ABQ7PX30_PLUXY|nr:hypothetical protein JYU34_019577 [Plutella xylostella]